MEKDDSTKAALDAYTNGVNAYIESLNSSQLPIEYKLLGYCPRKMEQYEVGFIYKANDQHLGRFR